MGDKELERLGPNGEITPRGENFVTQDLGYVNGIRRTFARRGGRNAEKFTNLVRYEMEPGTRDALIAQGKWPDEIGQNIDYVHLKNERGALKFGLRSGSVDVFNSRIIGHAVSR